MTENKRIVLNIVATYGRSLYGLVCGLFTTRWVLMSLGDTNYGLLGVIAGLAGFIGFLNSILSISVGRYFAFSVGRAKNATLGSQGLEECRQWFNTAFFLHSIFAIVLIAVGYPCGVWVVKHFLTIPPDRIDVCVHLFRFVCISCFVGMVTVPFNAMYTAKQLIAELTLYSFAVTTANFVFYYYTVTHPRDWLLGVGAWTCLVAIVPQLLISLRACMIFKEIRFNVRKMISLRHIRELGSFAGWYLFGMLGNLLRYQGMSILVNKYFGPTQNAAVTVANTVASQSSTLSGALVGAFSPAITNACGAAERSKMLGLVYRAEKYGTFLVMLFAYPMCMEMGYLLKLWLKAPPPSAAVLAIYVMVTIILEKIAAGHYLAISANGKIAKYQILIGSAFISTIFIAWGLMWAGVNVYAVGYSLVSTLLIAVVIRVKMFCAIFHESLRYWVKVVVVPLLLITCMSLIVGVAVRTIMPESFLRLIVVTLVMEITMLPLAWRFLIDKADKNVLLNRLKNLFRIK